MNDSEGGTELQEVRGKVQQEQEESEMPTSYGSTTVNIQQQHGNHKEKHKEGSGKYIKSMIYGGLDGLVSVFVSVAAVAGGQASITIVIVLGLAKLFAGAISMGVGDWMATAADVDQAATERKRETWEYDNYVEGEVEEMIELYVEKGLSEPTARRLFTIIAPHRKLFIDMMMVDELGILPEEEGQIPWKHGAVNFGSFIAFGIVPLLIYFIVVGAAPHFPTENIFYISIGMVALTLFMMGIIKSKLTGTNYFTSGVSTILFGSLGAAIGWGVSYGLSAATGGEQID